LVICPSPSKIGRRVSSRPHGLLQLKLGRVLAGDDALVVVDELRQAIEQRRFAGAGAARHDGVDAAAPDDLEDIGAFLLRSAEIHQLGERQLVLLELRMVRAGPSMASGGTMTLTREPSGRRASQIGDDSSTRRPIWLTMRWQMLRSC